MFAWGSFARQASSTVPLDPVPAGVIQFLITIYGGYFGGGIGFLMLSALTVAGLPVRSAGATKSALAAVMNASAVAIFVFSPEVCKGRRKYVPTGRSNRVPTGAAMNRRLDTLDSFFIERSCAVLNFSGTA